jgi:hypothetical protein
LLLSANPLDTETIRLDEEARTIEEVLAQAQILPEVYYATALRPRDLPKKLRTVRPHFVHFSGHGKENKGIVLENDQGLAQLIPQEALSWLFRLVKGVKCVFLNCCYSDSQAEAIAQYVPYVIGTKDAISDRAAIEFSFGFYQAIGDGETVPSAFEFGKNAIALEDYLDESSIPILFRRKTRKKGPKEEVGSTEVDRQEVVPSRVYSTDPERSVGSTSSYLEPNVPKVLAVSPVTRQEDSTSATLSHLWNRIEQRREMLIVLGSASCCEGRKEGESYPTFAAIARRILADEGRDLEHVADLRQELRSVLQLWSRDSEDLESFLHKYTSGEPGPAHYYLAALALTLFPEYNLLLFVTTGFDDLMEQALSNLQRGSAAPRCNVFRLSSVPTEEEIRRTFERVSDRLRRGEPTIVKIFGELGAKSPLVQRTVKLGEPLSASLRNWFQRPLLLVGFGPEDKSLGDLVFRAPRRGPIFIVGKAALQHRDSPDVHRIEVPFGQFVLALLDLLRSRDRPLLTRVEGLLRRLEPRALYPSCEAIATRSELASRPSLLRMEERLPRSDSDGTVRMLVPISRSETQPDLPTFLRGDRPLMAVIGESGTGKSTLFYQIYQAASSNYITIFYDVHELQSVRTLAERLAHDFLCEKHNLERLLAELDRVLLLGDSHLLILVDGLNESCDLKPATLRSELESIASRLPQRIKIAYSCRKVYWDNYIRPESEFPKKLYYGSKEMLLGRFSPRETEEAFQAYQNLYHFRGSYATLSDEFRQRITDPLMLRMLAEGYEGKELPSFAPAVLIFEAYERRLRQVFGGTYVSSFLTSLVAYKVAEARLGRSSDQFEAIAVRLAPDLGKLTQLQLSNPRRPGDPLVLLEDEGIISAIDEEKTAYRFAYDRFFEYLLGKALSTYKKSDSPEAFGFKLRHQVQESLSLHFSFLQALKSEIIRLNIIAPDGPWTMYDTDAVRSLLTDSATAVREFAKDLLRELMFEGRGDLLPVISQVFPDQSSNHLLMIDLAPDSVRTLPLVVEALLTGSSDTARRCCHILVNFIADQIHREAVETAILEKLRREPLTVRMASGLVYYTGCIFGDADRRSEDPFPVAQNFWVRVWGDVRHQDDAANIIADALSRLVREEGGRFFGDPNCEVMDYIWKAMSPECRQLALRLTPLIVDPEKEIDHEMREILLFFASCIRDWSDRQKPSLAAGYSYKLEYRIAQWILIQRSRSRYQEVKEILQGFVDTGYTRSIEIALSDMRYSCLFALRDDPALLRDAFETMQGWMIAFKQDEEGFYWALDTEDPYSLNECPLEMVGQISILDEFTPREGQVEFLVSWFESVDRRDRLFALLCARNLWPHAPTKILKTLELVADSFDTTMAMWLDKILKEIYLVHPRLVEDFFYRCQFDADRIRAIKHRADISDPSGIEHQGNPLYRSVFMGPRRRLERFGEWYLKLHQSSDLESFCSDLVHALLREVTECS